jgi:hypothetical protein
MIKKLALIASTIMLIPISSAADAGASRARLHWSPVPASGQAAIRFNIFDSAASLSAANAHRYRGGPKSNN